MADKKINQVTHPEYDSMVTEWVKWRLAYQGGADFVNKGLHTLSTRESAKEFNERKSLTYPPSHAKAAVNRVKHALTQRLVDVTREGGPQTFQDAVVGNGAYIDHEGNTMNGFISRQVLPELLPIGKVGIFVDREVIPDGATRADTTGKNPYVYVYKSEDIRSWTYDTLNQLQSVLLRDEVNKKDEYGLVSETEVQYRHMTLVDGSVKVDIYDKDGEYQTSTILDIPEIPLIILELSSSLMTDIADHQITLLNMASLDVSFLIKANFPFYTEQAGMQDMTQALVEQVDPSEGSESKPGTSDAVTTAKKKEIKVGPTKGRRYGQGVDRPAFIHPSSEPLRASMEKEQQIKEEINELLNLTIQTLHNTRASADSKDADDRGMISGLSYIGQELQYAEMQIMRYWAMYEDELKNVGTIKYPVKYTLQSDSERLAEAEKLSELLPTLPSLTYQKVVGALIARTMLAARTSEDNLDKIETELNEAKIIAIDPEVIRDDVEAGILSRETASTARGYPEGEADKAAKEHAERVERIKKAQENRTRGDVDNDDSPAENESQDKELSRDTTMEDNTTDRTRGDAK
jgi:hypothetical protein